METATTSGSQRGGRGRLSPNAASGCRFPNRRIQRSVALSETCTRHAPPSYSFPSVITLGFDSRVGNLRSRSCRARRRCRKQGGTRRRDPALAWATRGTGGNLAASSSPNVSRTCLNLLHVEPAKRLYERVELLDLRSSFSRKRNKKEDEREKPTLLTSSHGPPGNRVCHSHGVLSWRSAAHSSGPNHVQRARADDKPAGTHPHRA